MSTEENKAIVRGYFEEALNHPEVYEEILTPGFRVTAIHHATINPEGGERRPGSMLPDKGRFLAAARDARMDRKR